MSFSKYVAEAQKTYRFRIRSLEELDDGRMAEMEKALSKYRPESVSAPVRTMFQTNPLGFTGVKAGEVWIVDVVLTIGVTATLLEYDLRSMLHFDKFDGRLIVTGEHDPIENDPFPAETETEEEKTDTAGSQSLFANTVQEEPDADFADYYGDDYNEKFLQRLAKAEEENRTRRKAGPVVPMNPLGDA